MRVRDLMTRDIVAVSPQTTIREARQRLQESRLRCLPVTVEGRLVGLVLAAHPALARAGDGQPVSEVMQPPTASIHPRHTVDRAAVLMLEHDVRGLPVVGDDGRLVGVLTVRDLLAGIVRSPPIVLWK